MPEESFVRKSTDKYHEYKKKLNSWVQLFEEEYGVPPTDEDCRGSSTWTALNEKARYYKKQLGGRDGDGGGVSRHSRHESTPSTHDHSRSMSRRDRSTPSQRRHHSSASPPDRSRSSKSFRRGPSREDDSIRDTGHSVRRRRKTDSPDMHRKSRRDFTERSSSPNTRRPRRSEAAGRHHDSTERASRASGDEDEPPLPSLPEASSALRAQNDYAMLETKAREALEKLKKWERAFERDGGEQPSREDKAASGTYNGYKRKYKGYVQQLQELLDSFEAKGGAAGSGGDTAGLADESAGAAAESFDQPVAAPRNKRMAVSAESRPHGGAAAADDEAGAGEPAVVPKSKEAVAFLNSAAKNGDSSTQPHPHAIIDASSSTAHSAQRHESAAYNVTSRPHTSTSTPLAATGHQPLPPVTICTRPPAPVPAPVPVATTCQSSC